MAQSFDRKKYDGGFVPPSPYNAIAFGGAHHGAWLGHDYGIWDDGHGSVYQYIVLGLDLSGTEIALWVPYQKTHDPGLFAVSCLSQIVQEWAAQQTKEKAKCLKQKAQPVPPQSTNPDTSRESTLPTSTETSSPGGSTAIRFLREFFSGLFTTLQTQAAIWIALRKL